MSLVTYQQFLTALPTIVSNIPEEWKGTTYNNSNLLGREKFAEKFASLISEKSDKITTQDLTDLGNAEDYLRVSSNISSTYEFLLAAEKNINIAQVFTFSSQSMTVLSVLLSTNKTVHLYVGENGDIPFTQEQITMFKSLECQLEIHSTAAQAHADAIVLSTLPADFTNQLVDGIISQDTLYINNINKITPNEILVIRKRMSTPITTPLALNKLQKLANLTVTSDIETPTKENLSEFLEHLQALSGVKPDPNAYPVAFTSGLPAICALYVSLISSGGADVVMASTAYGGSSQLTDVLSSRGSPFNKHTFDITGTNDIQEQIQKSLNNLAAKADTLFPTTLLFIEIPTNPDMKVPEIQQLSKMASIYKQQTKKEIIIMVDTTFAPNSQVLQKIREIDAELTTLVFISMSKSVSRGVTTAGTIVAGESKKSQELLEKVRNTASLLNTNARNDQLVALVKNHTGVEKRCQQAYEIAAAVGESLVNAVKQNVAGHDMHLHFPNPQEAKLGFTSSTFSFNLPPKGSVEVNLALAQNFVDLLTKHSEYKPCVSFGQDNGLVYATVPATSTQGAIKLEDKAKQAVGGVQLVRLSFPPTLELQKVQKIIVDAVETIYKQ